MRHRRTTNRFLVALHLSAAGAFWSSSAFAQTPASIALNPAGPCDKKPSATVHLNGAAPANGVVVLLSSSVPASAAVPASVTVKQGATAADFQITCVPSSQAVAVTLSASVSGNPGTATAVLNVPAPVLGSIAVDPHTGGESVNARATLVSAAGPGGVVVTLSSSSTKATVPPFVTVSERATVASFTIQTRPVAQPTSVSIIGTGLGVAKTAELSLQPPRPTAIGFNTKQAPGVLAPTKSVESSNGAQLRVNLSTEAPCCGFPVQVSSSKPAVVTVPASVTIETGARFTDFPVSTKSVAQTNSVTITATSGGASQSCTLTVTPPELRSFSLIPATLVGGQQGQGRLFYFAPAPPGGTRVVLSSNNAALVGMPNSVLVPEGEQELLFPIETSGLEQRAVVTISVDASGQKKTAQLEIVPEGPSAIGLTPNPITGGINVKGHVEAIRSDDAFTVHLTSSNPDVASVPGFVSFSSGVTRRDFMVSTTPVAQDAQVTITATTTSAAKGTAARFLTAAPRSSFTVTRSLKLDVLAPVVSEITLAASSLVGGAQTTGTVTINGKAPAGGLLVSLSSSHISVVGVSPVRVPAGARTAPFTVSTSSVTSTVFAHITARTGNTQRSVALEVRKP